MIYFFSFYLECNISIYLKGQKRGEKEKKGGKKKKRGRKGKKQGEKGKKRGEKEGEGTTENMGKNVLL